MKRNCSILASLAAASFFAILLVETGAFAQKASVPKPENAPRLSQSEVRKLLALIDTDKNGKITKQEWMKFMEAEFERLDKDHSGDLDAKDLEESRVRASVFSTAGK
jgi:EF hand domain-containing protein